MPNSKHAIIRYQALDKCFRNTGRKYFIEDLVEACRVALVNHTGNDESIQKRQVYDDINFMISENGYNAPIEKDKVGRKVYYFYDDVNFTFVNDVYELPEVIAINKNAKRISYNELNFT